MQKTPANEKLEASTTRWMWSGVILMGLFFAAFPIYRIYEPSSRAAAQEQLTGFLADHGGSLYGENCVSCHGIEGRGGLGPALGSSQFLQSVDDKQIVQLISLGIPGTEMVSYSIDYGGSLSSEEIKAIATYLRSLEENAVSNPIWRTPLADENLSGQDLYNMACARCHGVDREGRKDTAPSLGPTSFALEENDDWLRDRITNGKEAMPRWGGVLTVDQIDKIIAFLRGVPFLTTTTTVPPTDGATTTVGDSGDAEILAIGKEIFEVSAGGVGCASCHGFDAAGTGKGPNIIGASKSNISGALGGGVPDMADIKLTKDQLDAVYQYLRTLG